MPDKPRGKPFGPAHPGKPFAPGNPGRPPGGVRRLREHFIEACYADFVAYGESAIVRVRDEEPAQYLRVIAAIIPREVHVKVSELEELSDEELEQRIRHIDRQLLELRAREIAAGASEPSDAEPAQALLPVPETKELP
jgi:hypothetical protein